MNNELYLCHTINILKIAPFVCTEFCRFTILLKYDEEKITIENHVGLYCVNMSLFVLKILYYERNMLMVMKPKKTKLYFYSNPTSDHSFLLYICRI